MHDVMSRAAENLGWDLVYTEEAQWATMIQTVENGRADIVVSGIWPSSQRATRAAFTEAVYFSPVYAYVRADDSRFDGNLEAANDPGVRIGALDGELSAIIAASDYPEAQMVALPQGQDVSQLLLELATDKADITFVEPAIAQAYMEANPGALKRVESVPPVRVFPNTLLAPIDEPELLRALNVAIEEMHSSGAVDAILSRYDENGTLFLRAAAPYRVDEANN